MSPTHFYCANGEVDQVSIISYAKNNKFSWHVYRIKRDDKPSVVKAEEWFINHFDRQPDETYVAGFDMFDIIYVSFVKSVKK